LVYRGPDNNPPRIETLKLDAALTNQLVAQARSENTTEHGVLCSAVVHARTVLGTADQVAERIAFWCEQAQSSKIILHLHVGDMPHWKAVKNITLFAEEVIPRVRKLTSSSLQVAAE
jgi:hypothetical protein